MSKKIYTDLDLTEHQLLDTRVENVSSLPSAGNKGRIVILTTTNLPYYDDGSAWQLWGSGSTVPDASDTVKGITKLSVTPASPTTPIAFGANDTSVILTTTTLGGDLNGNLPNGNVNKATASVYGISKLSTAPASAGVPIVVGDNDSRLTDARTPTGSAGGGLNGTYPNPGVNKATTSVYGVSKLATAPASAGVPIVVGDNDSRLTDSRTPTGSAGGDLTGTYPNPTLTTSGVSAGNYTNSSITVDAKGRVTTASSGTAPVTSVTATSPIVSSGGATPNITHATSGVSAATYTNATVAVDNKGHITSASSGTAPVTSVTGTAPIASSGGATPAISIAVTPANPGGAVVLQSSTPGTAQTGNLNINGTGTFGSTSLTGANAIIANNNDAGFQTIVATNASSGIAINGLSTDGTGIQGGSTNNAGVYGTSTNAEGVWGNSASSAKAGTKGVSSHNGGYGVLGQNTASTDGTGSAGRFDGGTHTNGLQVVNNHATKETINGTNSGAGSAGIFANNGAQTTVTGTNSGAGDGIDGSSAGGAFFGVKGTNTASSDGTGAGGKFDGGTHTVGVIITTNHATKEALSAIQSGAGPVVAGYSGATVTSQINTDGSANLYVSPNYVMNGDMLVNQRLGPGGTVAIASGTNTTYGLDRWRLDKNGTSAGTFGQVAFTVGQTAVPDEPTYYLDWNHSTAGTGATKDNIENYIESVRTLAGKQVTLSFYGMVASSTATVACELEQNFGTGGSPSSVVTSTAQNNTFTTTWTKFSYTVTLGSISGKTIGTTANTSALVVRFKCPLNTAVHPSIAHVQLEPGPIATPFRVEGIGDTLNKCYRYFYKSFPYATAPAQNAGRTGELYLPAFKAGATAQNLNMNPFYIPMRVTPTFTYFNPGAANALAHTYGTGNADCSATSTGFSSERHIVIQVTTPINTVVGDGVGVHLTGGADYGD